MPPDGQRRLLNQLYFLIAEAEMGCNTSVFIWLF
jgi:hypothetical protein